MLNARGQPFSVDGDRHIQRVPAEGLALVDGRTPREAPEGVMPCANVLNGAAVSSLVVSIKEYLWCFSPKKVPP